MDFPAFCRCEKLTALPARRNADAGIPKEPDEDAGVSTEFWEVQYSRYYRLWFYLGWPAFTGVLVVFYLMVVKPAI